MTRLIAAALTLLLLLSIAQAANADNSDLAVKARAAVAALDDLNAVTAIVSYRDYTRRVADTKAIVERYLRVAPADNKARVYIERAEGYHEKALDAWGEIIFNGQYRLRDLVRTYWNLAKGATDDARPLIPAPDPI